MVLFTNLESSTGMRSDGSGFKLDTDITNDAVSSKPSEVLELQVYPSIVTG